jgi:adenine-specific DNA-methyltransferase
MSTQSEKLISLLKELFQTDQAELDFGMYRVINQRRDEINRFLEEDLLPQVETAFSTYQSVDTKTLQNDLKKAIQQANELGVDPETTGKVKEIREQIETYSVDVGSLEEQVYSALFNFFRRYYDSGDFISQRRYKEGVYAIPYEGEEVKLHWANHDQYYIKTSEYLRDYTFKLPSGKNAHFKLIEADEEKDNRKETDDNKRRFILADDSYSFKDGELAIHFEFRPDEEKRTQKKLNQQAVESIIALRGQVGDQKIKDVLTELAMPAPTESDKNRTLLEKHIEDYTRRNTSDYFIHKDLRTFLRRELDFFIKNEIMQLDDIENDSVPRVEQYLSKVKVIRKIAHKIIDFLAQIENFQKKLWLKKKFVVETNYCITLDRIPEELYPEIAANDAQREEWVRLFAIDKIKKDLVTVAYSNPLTTEFLKANPFLVLDTKFFDDDFKYRLLSNIENLEKFLDGLLVHSENFQALNCLLERYEGLVDYVYIDPPYNRPGTDSEILYKNNFPNSTWLSLLFDRLLLSRKFFAPQTPITIAIDDHELANLSKLLDITHSDFSIQRVIVNHYPGSGSGRGNISRTHEYALFAVPADQDILRGKRKMGGERVRGFRRSGTGENNYRQGRPNSFFAVLVDPEDFSIVGVENPPEETEKNYPLEKTKDGYLRVYPFGEDNSERVWSLSYEGAILALENDELYCTPNLIINRRYNDDEGREVLISLWSNVKFNAATHGTNLLTDILGDSSLFSYPKSVFTVQTSIDASMPDKKMGTIMDFFAGSGTTGHAVINLNRKDDGSRKYLLVEMGQYFETVTKPRIQKVVYSEDWKDGKPVSRKGSSHAFKYIKLESYEDTLNNLELRRTNLQSQILPETGTFKEDYLLRYMLDIEAKDSLLNLKTFEKPFDCKLDIASSTVGETVPTKIDLVETFNYLIGLNVKTISKISGCVVVEGSTQDDEKALIIWRNIREMNNEALDEFFRKLDISTRDFEYDVIYVNGDNNLPNLRREGEDWKVKLIEEEFHNRMFEER